MAGACKHARCTRPAQIESKAATVASRRSQNRFSHRGAARETMCMNRRSARSWNRRALPEARPLRLVSDYRKKYLDLLLRGGEEKREQFDTSLNPLPERGGEGAKRNRRRRITSGQDASGQGLRGD